MITTFNDTYEIKSIIDHGGMSTVYLAEHKRLHTRWAVKSVSKHQGTQFDFLAESNILKRLHHPMLPRIVDIFEDNDSIYIVEDFVEGITLEQLLRREKKVSEAQGLQWFRDLCDVLIYLHNQHPNPIIYRDMKPSNIMLQPDGTLKLVDFGIAREYKQTSHADTTYIGTEGYAAPEQFGSAQTDTRTDIYSLGVTMYHILSGKSPYEPPYQFIPIRQMDKSLSAGTEYILNKCTQTEPEARYQRVEELLYDLEHIYRFDDAWKIYKRTKHFRVAILAVLLVASASLLVTGQVLMAFEKENTYTDLLEQASDSSLSDYNHALSLLEEAQAMFPDRVDSYRQYAYTLYQNEEYQTCANYGEDCLKQFPEDGQMLLTIASAYFEMGDYKAASENFYTGAQYFEMNADNLRDYAVCLGRMGDIDEAGRVLAQLEGQGASPEVTTYVQGEVYLAQKQYLQAESSFLSVLEETDDEKLLRRCYISLGDLYRDCAALARSGTSPISTPATKSAQILSDALTTYGWRSDSVLWEMLALAYFEAYHTDPSVPQNYLTNAADCFQLVLDLGIQKSYLYTNLYTIYYEMKDYTQAEAALAAYETAFPDDYTPSALRGILLITIENQKPQTQRNYSQALVAYKKAGELLRSEDDTTYYQQLGSLIESLRTNHWL